MIENDNRKCEAYEVKQKDCQCCLEHANIKNDLAKKKTDYVEAGTTKV